MRNLLLYFFAVHALLLVSVHAEEGAAENFAASITNVLEAHQILSNDVQSVLAIDNNIQGINDQIAANEDEIANLEQQANDIAMLASQPVPPGGGGGGGGGGGSGDGGGGGSAEPPQLPELAEAPQFELPPGPTDGGLDSVASALGGGPGRGFSPGQTDFSGSPGLSFPKPQENPGFISPATVASGKLPLSGPTSIPNAIAGDPNAFNNSSNAPSGGGAGASGMNGGQGGGATPGGGASDGGGDSLASVGMEPPEGEAPRPRIETTQAGVGGDGGTSGSEGFNAGGDPDDSPVKAQISKNGTASPLEGKESTVKNPEGKGLMGWVGWIGDSCKANSAKELLGVCSGKKLGADEALSIAVHKETAAKATQRVIASDPEEFVAPVEASAAGPVREGILGLLSGK